eukprot:8575217-Pyramimonas_sp.AAC.2
MFIQPTQANKSNDEKSVSADSAENHVTSGKTEVADGKVRTRESMHLAFRSCKDHGPRSIRATRATCSAH